MSQLMEVISLGIVIKLIAWPIFLVVTLILISVLIRNYELKKVSKR